MTTPDTPNDQNAEKGVIACCIIDPDCIGKCLDRNITAETFFNPIYKMVYKSLLDMWNKTPDIDEISLADNLKSHGWLEDVGGIIGINEISGCVETSLHFDMWAELIEGHSVTRKLRTLCLQTLDGISEGMLSANTLATTMDDEVMRITKEQFRAEYFHDSADAVALSKNEIAERLANSGKQGISSGINDLDVRLKGFKKAELTLLAARPSVGKTAFSLHCLIQSAVKEGVPTLYQSIEMSASSLMMRLVSALARVPMGMVDENILNENQKTAMYEAHNKLECSPFWIDETPSPSIANIRARARRLKSGHGLGFIIIDYLQLIRARDSRIPREQQVAEMSNSLKNLSKELDIPILLLCQLNRQSEIAGRGPKLSDLRESGQLEQDCDVCLMLWKPDTELPNLVQCDISKNRNGQSGFAKLNFQKSTQRFEPHKEEGYDESPTPTPTQTTTRFGK
jgi:replicative DNA helicase